MDLRAAFGAYPSGVVALCALRNSQPDGMAVSTFTPVSLDPPLVSVSIQRSSTTWARLRHAPRLGLSVLAEAHDIVGRRLSLKNVDRFGDVAVTVAPTKALFIDNSCAWLEGSIHIEYAAGDHLIALLTVEEVHTFPEMRPLVFHRSRFNTLDHELRDP